MKDCLWVVERRWHDVDGAWWGPVWIHEEDMGKGVLCGRIRSEVMVAKKCLSARLRQEDPAGQVRLRVAKYERVKP
jgi:hypothetical protein